MNVFPLDSAAPKSLKAKAERLQEKVDTLAKNRADAAEQVAEAQNAGLDDLVFGNVAEEVNATNCVVLQDELALLGELADFAVEAAAAHSRLRDDATEKLGEVKRAATDQLRGIGYRDKSEARPGDRGFTQFFQGMVLTHPAVWDAQERVKQLGKVATNGGNTTTYLGDLNRRMQAIQDRVASARRRLLAVAHV